VSCGLESVYGFLQGAWPSGFVEAIWSIVAVICPLFPFTG
jgi:hypothetical protein